MGQVRGSAIFVTLVAILLCVVLNSETVHAISWTVGDGKDWSFGVQNWPQGKSFKTGDVLVFKYETGFHNVVKVDKSGYDTCTVTEGSQTYTTGHDQIKIEKGPNYFICGFPGHCTAGMKISVTAS